MAQIGLADSYRMARLSPTPEVMGLRQSAFDKVRLSIDGPKAVALSRMYFGLPLSKGGEWFHSAFAENDPSFSLVDNAREAAVLAGSLLHAAALAGKSIVGLVTLTTSAGGIRTPLVCPEFLQSISDGLADASIRSRKHQTLEFTNLKLAPKNTITAESLASFSAVAQLFPTMQQLGEQAVNNSNNLANQLHPLFSSLINHNAQLREEVDILWWFVAGWSKLLDQPFSEMTPPQAAVLSGIDLSDLSQTVEGPVAAPALLQRILSNVKKYKGARISISEIIDGFPTDKLPLLGLGNGVDSLADVCPLLYGLHKTQEVGRGPAWHAAFRKNARLRETDTFAPLDLAVQMMRERTVILDLEA